MDMTEKKISSEEVFHGRIINVRVDRVELPNGHESIREIIEHPGGVGILALDDEMRVPVVTQYRYAFSKNVLEIPAGKREPGEEPFVTAQRELMEEVGATADEWIPMGEIMASPGCYTERLFLFLAKGLHFGENHPDDDEFLEENRMPFEELYEKCMNGEIKDGKTVIAVLKTKLLLGI